MKYQKITRYDTANGIGIRVVLWVSGCNHYCEGCHNPETWNCNNGELFTKKTMEQLLEFISKPWINGITFSGGDPLFPNNRSEVFRLAKKCKELFPDKTVWLYTGYTWEQICDLDLSDIDGVAEGEFVEALKDNSLKWIGSSNQRVINVPETLKTKEVVLI